MFFDFWDRVDDPGPNSLGLPVGWVDSAGWVQKAYMLFAPVDIFGNALPDGLLGMAEGEQLLAKGLINFRDVNQPTPQGGLLYTIRFKPNSWVDSNWLLMTRHVGEFPCDESVLCASWTIEALNGTPDPASDNCCNYSPLEDIGTLKSDNSNDEGDYHLPFSITVTALPQQPDDGGGGGNGKGKGGGNK